MSKIYAISTALMFMLFSFQSKSQEAPTITYETPSFISGLSSPVDLVNAGDGSNRLFVVQQGGKIMVRSGTTPFGVTEFLDLGPAPGLDLISTGGERGLLSMAFHPDYDGTTNRFFFVYYTEVSTGRIIVRRFQTSVGNVNTVEAGSLLIMAIDHPLTNHNGGKLNFGPDGYLYFATGDGGGSNDPSDNAQNGASLLGKMIRIDINNPIVQPNGNYVIPPTNPYVGDGGAVRDEVWALGLRNPFRWSFDRANGNMWIGDVGQGEREEVNYRPAATSAHVNYGWDCYEGMVSTPSVPDCHPADNVFPVFDYDNPTIGQAVTGGFVYRGPGSPTLAGRYIAADYFSGNVFLIWPNSSGVMVSNTQPNTVNNVAAFGEAEDGTLYAVIQDVGAVRRVVSTDGWVLPVGLNSFTASRFSSYNELKWATASDLGISKFYIEFSADGRSFERLGEAKAQKNANGSNYSFQHQLSMTKDLYYRLAIEGDGGRIKYSSILRLLAGNGIIKIYPTLIQNGMLNLSLSKPAQRMQLVNSNGAIVYEKSLKGITGSTAIHLPTLARGTYIARILMGEEVLHEKLVIE